MTRSTSLGLHVVEKGEKDEKEKRKKKGARSLTFLGGRGERAAGGGKKNRESRPRFVYKERKKKGEMKKSS